MLLDVMDTKNINLHSVGYGSEAEGSSEPVLGMGMSRQVTNDALSRNTPKK